ncbi:MAG: hypothetical protein QW548_00215 [Candidatus Aenigmatarchaeota archaeon]
MAYRVGISTGWWKVARPAELLGLAAKIAYGVTAGVTFVQVDLETTSEFLEPGLKPQVERVKSLGMEVGVHAELGEVMALESAEWRLWDQAQKRLCETLKHAADLGFTYVNVHLSTKPQLLHEEARFRVFGYQYPVVSFDGQPLSTVCDKVPAAKEVAFENIWRTRHDAISETKADEALREKYRKKEKEDAEREVNKLRENPHYRQLPDAEKRKWEEDVRDGVRNRIWGEHGEYHAEMNSREFVYNCWKAAPFSRYILDNSEIGAYEIVANLMIHDGDPLWSNIVGGKRVEEVYMPKQAEYNAALAAKYIEGHLTTKSSRWNKELLEGMSIKEFCNAKKIYLLFEAPHAEEGQEGMYRLFDPRHAYYLIKKLNSPFIKQCIDFEHLLANKLRPDEVIEKLPEDAGKQILLFHLGRPIPYFGTAHVPIQRGSHAQEVIYKWLWALKQKGFSDGYIIFERGGGQTPLEVMQDSVLALRLIAAELEKGTKPDELPASFYGVAEQNEAVFARQRVAIRDNFMAPISGLIAIPEETHTFLGRAAIEKGKAEEWKRGRYR